MSKKQKIFSLFIEFPVVENRPKCRRKLGQNDRRKQAKMILQGLKWSSVSSNAAEQITATQVFSTELMFVIPCFVADPIFSWWSFRPIH